MVKYNMMMQQTVLDVRKYYARLLLTIYMTLGQLEGLFEYLLM